MLYNKSLREFGLSASQISIKSLPASENGCILTVQIEKGDGGILRHDKKKNIAIRITAEDETRLLIQTYGRYDWNKFLLFFDTKIYIDEGS